MRGRGFRSRKSGLLGSPGMQCARPPIPLDDRRDQFSLWGEGHRTPQQSRPPKPPAQSPSPQALVHHRLTDAESDRSDGLAVRCSRRVGFPGYLRLRASREDSTAELKRAAKLRKSSSGAIASPTALATSCG